MENRDKNHGRAAADSATHIAPAQSAWDSPAARATEKEAIRSRLGNSIVERRSERQGVRHEPEDNIPSKPP